MGALRLCTQRMLRGRRLTSSAGATCAAAPARCSRSLRPARSHCSRWVAGRRIRICAVLGRPERRLLQPCVRDLRWDRRLELRAGRRPEPPPLRYAPPLASLLRDSFADGAHAVGSENPCGGDLRQCAGIVRRDHGHHHGRQGHGAECRLLVRLMCAIRKMIQ